MIDHKYVRIGKPSVHMISSSVISSWLWSMSATAAKRVRREGETLPLLVILAYCSSDFALRLCDGGSMRETRVTAVRGFMSRGIPTDLYSSSSCRRPSFSTCTASRSLMDKRSFCMEE